MAAQRDHDHSAERHVQIEKCQMATISPFIWCRWTYGTNSTLGSGSHVHTLIPRLYVHLYVVSQLVCTGKRPIRNARWKAPWSKPHRLLATWQQCQSKELSDFEFCAAQQKHKGALFIFCVSLSRSPACGWRKRTIHENKEHTERKRKNIFVPPSTKERPYTYASHADILLKTLLKGVAHDSHWHVLIAHETKQAWQHVNGKHHFWQSSRAQFSFYCREFCWNCRTICVRAEHKTGFLLWSEPCMRVEFIKKTNKRKLSSLSAICSAAFAIWSAYFATKTLHLTKRSLMIQ